jgi:ATP-dependent helicase/nuclease subunit B
MVVVSERAQVRLDAARAWLDARPPTEPCLVVGATMEAANQIVRARLESTGVLFGTHRLTLGALTSILAGPELARNGEAILSSLSMLAVVTRIVYRRRGSLGRFEPVGERAGLPRALADTLRDLRLAAIDPDALAASDPDLAAIYAAYCQAIRELKLADDARILEAAAAAASPLMGIPTLFVDVPLHTVRERAFVEALRARAPQFLATAPAGDDRTIQALGEPSTAAQPAHTSLERVQRFLFDPEARPPEAVDDGTVTVLSAPGEGRECTELMRQLLHHARAGVPFDQMAILVHEPAPYRARLGEAFRRARIPAAFAEGTRLPDPAGRAFLALLACQAHGLSAVRFAEYLSLGEVPEAQLDGSPPPARTDAVAPADEKMAARLPEPVQLSLFDRPRVSVPPDDAADRAVIDGKLRVPRQWERLIVDAAVIGGIGRWRRRLAGLQKRLELERAYAEQEGRALHTLDSNLKALGSLRAFAIPLLEDLAALPAEATWGTWCELLSRLSTRALRDSERIETTLAELAPMADVGPVSLDQVRLVLEQRLTDLLRPPPRRTEGAVFVGTTDHARGRSFRVVLVPGLAERMFPQKILEDTILVDAARKTLSPDLETNEDRIKAERLSLRLAVGAANDSLVVSYPRLDTARERPRVPSFYCLELLRVVRGELPDLQSFARESAAHAGARAVGWPAPASREEAIDDAEYDLVVLGSLLGKHPTTDAATSARYLVEVNRHLYRALLSRHQRWIAQWTAADGLLKIGPEARAALDRQQLGARAFSASALQGYAECPYRFFLSALLRLAPWEIPDAVEQMPPAEKGSLVHEVIFLFLSRLRDGDRLPLDPAILDEATRDLDRILEEVAAKYEDDLAPAISRVWQDELALVRNDLHLWLKKLAENTAWVPWRFELAFGLPHHVGDTERDPESVPEPVLLSSGIRFRGAIDLVERAHDGSLRMTDHKTGKAPEHHRDDDDLLVDGGRLLQPVLYALALEKLYPDRKVAGGRLHYCTTRGRFEERWVPLDGRAREAADLLARAVGSDLDDGSLPAAPAEGACKWCDFRVVCGAFEEARTARKQRNLGAPLKALRKLP